MSPDSFISPWEAVRQLRKSNRQDEFFSGTHESADRIPSCLEQPLGKLTGYPFSAPEMKFQTAFPWHS